MIQRMATSLSFVTRGDPSALRHLVIFFTIVNLFQVMQADSFGDVNGSYTICMDAGRGCEDKGCQENCTNLSDINFPTNNFISQVNVKFCTENILLQSVLMIKNPNYSIAITGFPTKIKCENNYGGIHIDGVNGLTLQGISLTSCGSIFNDSYQQDKTENVHFMSSSIFITMCQDVTIENVTVSESQGNGLTMFDNGGNVTIHNCTFKDNKPSNLDSNQTFKACGSGLHIVLSYCQPRNLTEKYNCSKSEISHSVYNITKCNFIGNAADSTLVNGSVFNNQHELLAEGFNRGGGLSIVIDMYSKDNKVLVIDSKFTNNSASWGGGLYVAIVANSSNSNVIISNCKFYNNSSPHLGGGGAVIGYQHYQGLYPQENSITFNTCSFKENSALIGGGVSFYSSPSTDFLNKVVFRNCTWNGNDAKLGSAVDISPQAWESYVHDLKTSLLFSDCNFLSNYPTEPKNHTYVTYLSGSGAFLAVGYRVTFERNIHFDGNNGSALYLDSADIEFKPYSNVTFIRNRGFSGGAINMQGFSTLILNDSITISFLNNSADLYGGAIYQQSFDKRDYLASQSCFIKYIGVENSGENDEYNLSFEYNTAGEGCNNDSIEYARGQSIFADTILPCINSKVCPTTNNDIFKCIGHITFKGDCNDSISTSGGNITMDTNNVIFFVVPGKIEELPIVTWNDVRKEVLNTYKVTIKKVGNSTIQVASAYTFISNKLIRFYGLPGDKGNVTLESIHRRKIVYEFQVQIQECPPGFVIEHDGHIRCVCSRVLSSQRCDEENFETILLAGNYWMGYNASNTSNEIKFGKENQLMYSITCPFGYCLLGENITLPQNTSATALEEVVCGSTRKGTLCGQCRDNYSVHYHDTDYNCKKGNCKFGWLFYIISEIIPVTAFFIVIIVFNINFTDGAINGIVLFAQISDTLGITGNEIIQFPTYSHIVLKLYRFIIGIFNLNFFSIDSLSFCIWRSASTLDLLAFKYITILYASTLVAIIIVIFKYCHNKRINHILVKVKGESAASIKSTIIHGVSGFLVICYSECIRISLLLITQVPLFLLQKDQRIVIKRVVFYDGNLEFFRDKHLFYALPALFIVLTLGIFPPLILMSYPLCYKVFTLLRINETKFTKLLCTCLPLENFKPFFDSFQSSFKDKYRLFSGLYFLYRLTTLVSFAFAGIKFHYILVQIQFSVIFAVHALCQPYKNRWHNILDALLFLNLSLINLITLFNFQVSRTDSEYNHYIILASVVQIILLFLPLVYISVYSAVKVFYKVKNWKLANSSASQPDDYYNFPLNAAEDR